MRYPPSVYINDELMVCEFTAQGNAVVLDDIAIPWGRDSLYAPTNPSEVRMTFLDPVGQWASDPALFGAKLRIDTSFGTLFRGNIDGITMTPDEIPATEPDADPVPVWRVDITASDVIAELASTVVPGYEINDGTSPAPQLLALYRSEYGPGFWWYNNPDNRLKEIENRMAQRNLLTQIETVDFATIAPPGVDWAKYFRDPIRRAGDDLYTMVQSVQLRANEPIHTNYDAQRDVLAAGGFPEAAGLILTYVNSVIDIAVDAAGGDVLVFDCNQILLGDRQGVNSTVEQTIGSLRIKQSDYATDVRTADNGSNYTIQQWGEAELDFVVPNGKAAQYAPSPMVIGNMSIKWAGDAGPTQSQTAADYAAKVAPIIGAINGKLIPPPFIFDLEAYDYGADIEEVLLKTWTTPIAWMVPGSQYETLTGFGTFFQHIGGELHFQQGWEITAQAAPAPALSDAGGLTISQIVTTDGPTFDQYADTVLISTLGQLSKGL